MNDADHGITAEDALDTFGPPDEDQIPEDVKYIVAYGAGLFYDEIYRQAMEFKHRAEALATERISA